MAGTHSILLIEDEEIFYTVLEKSLQDAGFSVTIAKDGHAGLAAVQKQRCDLILLDILLPGLSGLDVLAKLKQDEKTRDIPVLILSQLSDQDNISRAVSLGASGYLVKSQYGLEDIVGKVRNFFVENGKHAS